MATDVRAALSRGGGAETARAHATKRLVVLPFKVLRPDPEVDFLAFSLPDAITVSLSGLDSLTVRSSLAAARFSEGVLDLRAVASELSVEAAITGTLLHAGKAVRVAVQLVEVPSGTVRWSHTAQVALDDLFTIQDSVCAAVVDAFALKLTQEGTRGAAAGRARQPGGVRALPARQPAEHERHAVGARQGSLHARRRGRSVVCAGVGAARTRPPQHRQVRAHPGRARPIPAGGRGVSACVRAQSRPAADAQPLHLHGSRDGPRARRGAAPARPAEDAHQRSRPVRRPGPGVPLRRPARCLGRRLPPRDAPRSRHRHQRGALLFHARPVSARHRSRIPINRRTYRSSRISRSASPRKPRRCSTRPAPTSARIHTWI